MQPVVICARLGCAEEFEDSLGFQRQDDFPGLVEWHLIQARHAQAYERQQEYDDRHKPKLFVELTSPQGELQIEAEVSEELSDMHISNAKVTSRDIHSLEHQGNILEVLQSMMSRSSKPAFATSLDHELRESFKEGEKIQKAWEKLCDDKGLVYESDDPDMQNPQHAAEPPVEKYDFRIPALRIEATLYDYPDRESREIQAHHFYDEEFENKHQLYHPDREKKSVVKLSHPEYGDLYLACAGLEDSKYQTNYILPEKFRNINQAPSFTVEVNNPVENYETPKHVEVLFRDTQSGDELRLSTLNHLKKRDMDPKQHKVCQGVYDLVGKISDQEADPMGLAKSGRADDKGNLITGKPETNEYLARADFQGICSVEIFTVDPDVGSGKANSFEAAMVTLVAADRPLVVPCNTGAQDFFVRPEPRKEKAQAASKTATAKKSTRSR